MVKKNTFVHFCQWGNLPNQAQHKMEAIVKHVSSNIFCWAAASHLLFYINASTLNCVIVSCDSWITLFNCNVLSVEWCACDSYALLLLKSRMMISYNLIVVGHGAHCFNFNMYSIRLRWGGISLEASLEWGTRGIKNRTYLIYLVLSLKDWRVIQIWETNPYAVRICEHRSRKISQ